MPTQPLPGQPGFVVPAPQDRPRYDRRAVRVLVVDETDPADWAEVGDVPVRVAAVRTDGTVVVQGVITIYVSEKPAR